MTDPIRAALEAAAEALWQAESLRAAGRPRLTEWHEEDEHTRQKWRFMAAHGNAAFLRAMPGHILLAQAVLAAAKEERE